MSLAKFWIIICACLLISSSGFVSADPSFTFKKNDTFTLEIPIGNANISDCDDCSCTVDIFYPNGSVWVDGSPGTIRNGYCSYSNSTNIIGIYDVDIMANNSVDYGRSSFELEINAIGFPSTTARASAANRGVYVVFGLAALFFIGFIFIPAQSKREDEMGNTIGLSNHRPFKWTLFLISILFVTVGLNMTFISIYNDIGDTQLGAIYDKLAAGSSYAFWISFGLLIFLWVFTTISTLADKKRMKQAEQIGSSTRFDY